METKHLRASELAGYIELERRHLSAGMRVKPRRGATQLSQRGSAGKRDKAIEVLEERPSPPVILGVYPVEQVRFLPDRPTLD